MENQRFKLFLSWLVSAVAAWYVAIALAARIPSGWDFFNKEERAVGVVSYSTEVGIFWFYSAAFCRQLVSSVTFDGGYVP